MLGLHTSFTLKKYILCEKYVNWTNKNWIAGYRKNDWLVLDEDEKWQAIAFNTQLKLTKVSLGERDMCISVELGVN